MKTIEEIAMSSVDEMVSTHMTRAEALKLGIRAGIEYASTADKAEISYALGSVPPPTERRPKRKFSDECWDGLRKA